MIAQLLVRFVALALLTLSVPVVASAQTEEDHVVEGARDFRTAPVVNDGAYTDTILVGETLWYAVYLLNDDEKEFDVFTELLLEGRDDLILEVAWIGPTLGTLDSGDEIEAAAFYYGSSNDGATWLWFLKFSVESETGALEEIPFRFTVTGAEAHDSSACTIADDCELATQAVALESEIADLEETIATWDPDDPGDPVVIGPTPEDLALQDEVTFLENELSSLQGKAAGIEAEITVMEEVDQEPPSTDGSGLGGIALYVVGAALGGVGVLLLVRSRSASEE